MAELTYDSNKGKSRALFFFFGLILLISIIGTISSIFQLELVLDILNGERVSLETIKSNDSRQLIIVIMYSIVLLPTTILFLYWMKQSYANIQSFGSIGLGFTAGWAIGFFFVPIVSYWKPYQAMKEIWKASDPNFDNQFPHEGTGWLQAKVPVLVNYWWAFFIVNTLFLQLYLRAKDLFSPMNFVKIIPWTIFIHFLIGVAACITVMILVHKITKNQDLKFDLQCQSKESNIIQAALAETSIENTIESKNETLE